MIQYENITIHEAKQMIAGGLCAIFDIRDERSYEQGRIPGSMRFDDRTIRQMRKTPQRDEPVLIYCYHGHSSRDVAQMLCDFGFSKVYSLDGGYAAWDALENQTSVMIPGENVLPAQVSAWLAEQGFDPNNLDHKLDNGMSALMQACRFGLANTAETLLQAGANINSTNSDGNNALWLACFSGDLPTIQLLIDNGIEIDNKNVTGATSLIYASSAGKSAVVELLLEAGADPQVKTQDDFTALDLAASPRVFKLLRNR